MSDGTQCSLMLWFGEINSPRTRSRSTITRTLLSEAPTSPSLQLISSRNFSSPSTSRTTI
jgi:hypothetical protein